MMQGHQQPGITKSVKWGNHRWPGYIRKYEHIFFIGVYGESLGRFFYYKQYGGSDDELYWQCL